MAPRRLRAAAALICCAALAPAVVVRADAPCPRALRVGTFDAVSGKPVARTFARNYAEIVFCPPYAVRRSASTANNPDVPDAPGHRFDEADPYVVAVGGPAFQNPARRGRSHRP